MRVFDVLVNINFLILDIIIKLSARNNKVVLYECIQNVLIISVQRFGFRLLCKARLSGLMSLSVQYAEPA